MQCWVHKQIKISLAFVLICFSLLATGHFGHSHNYGKSDPGYCTAQCADSHHFDAKPLCKGFPLNLTLGIIHDNLVSDTILPVFFPEYIRSDHQYVSAPLAYKDHSRAPPHS